MNDRLTAAVAQALSTGFCPADEPRFIVTLVALVVAISAAGLALAFAARRSPSDSRFRFAGQLAGALLVIFALGWAALDAFGLAGCAGIASAGITWDAPW